VKIKICGITNLKDAKAAVNAGADILGFVFAKSPRRITPKTAAAIIEDIGPRVEFAGVFVDSPVSVVQKIIIECKIGILQFHGDESPEYCDAFRQTHKVFKAFRIKDKNDLKDLRRYEVDGYLLDTFVKDKKGGTGKTFDWKLAVDAKKLISPVILSGGLGLKNVKNAIRIVEPYMVDVSSGLEKSPGKKDLKLMKDFIKAVKDEEIT